MDITNYIITYTPWIVFLAVLYVAVIRVEWANVDVTGKLVSFNNGILVVEDLIVDFAASIVPYMAGLIPTAFTFRHTTLVLGVNLPMAIVISVVVELLGFAAIGTVMTFAQFNRVKKDNKNFHKVKAFTWIPISAAIFYLFVVLTVNGLLAFLLEAQGEDGTISEFVATWIYGTSESRLVFIFPTMAKVLAEMLLSLLTIPASVIVAVRQEHKDKLDRNRREHRKSKATPVPKNEPVVSVTDAQKKFYLVYKANQGKTRNEVAGLAGITAPTLRSYIKSLQDAGWIATDGKPLR